MDKVLVEQSQCKAPDMIQTDFTAVLKVNALSKHYGNKTAVNNVSFTINSGECYGLLGPNGAGKTTTISMLCGLIPPDSGEVIVMGEKLTQRSIAPRSYIGYVPQEIALYPELSPYDNLSFFGKLYGLGGKHLKKRIQEVLEIVGLSDRAKDKVQTFSGGMKRRANIAVGLLHNPKLLVLDEPTVGVDPQSRNAILESILNLRGMGMAILYTTHYMEEATRLCHRIGIIDNGELIAEGTLRALIDSFTSGNRLRVAPRDEAKKLKEICERLFGLENVEERGRDIFITTQHPDAAFTAIVNAAKESSIALISIEIVQPNLEDVFLALTGRELRD